MSDSDAESTAEDEVFCYDRPLPKSETVFEIGLVLAGAVSAGAYTAGVLDYLFEALDAWYEAKKDPKNQVPSHDVHIRVITGASAGGMNGAIAAVALDKVYPAARPDVEQSVRDRNPFYGPWVNDIDISKLLSVKDLENGLYSALDCSALDKIRDDMIRFEGQPGEGEEPDVPTTRGWIPPGWPLMLTVTNLRGVPYRIAFAGGSYPMSSHRDFLGFTAPVKHINSKSPASVKGYKPAPGFRSLDTTEEREHLGEAALATGAFPVGLRARRLSRPGTDYNARERTPDEKEKSLNPSKPNWSNDAPPEDYRFLCVDGGVMNNEPFELARHVLAGVAGSNERDGKKARRAVLMIDPFMEAGDEGPSEDVEIPDILLPLFDAMKSQTRFRKPDMDLIANEKTYSRFMIAPSRREGDTVPVRGKDALMSSGLGAFAGFLSRDYRHHDFMLGRRNCQRFLQTSFTLPRENRLFNGQDDAVLDRFADTEDPSHIQIIPIVSAVAKEETLLRLKTSTIDFNHDLKNKVENRVNAVIDAMIGRITGRKKAESFWSKVKAWAFGAALSTIKPFVRRWLVGKIGEHVTDAVKKINDRLSSDGPTDGDDAARPG